MPAACVKAFTLIHVLQSAIYRHTSALPCSGVNVAADYPEIFCSLRQSLQRGTEIVRVLSRIKLLDTGFGLVIRIIGLLQLMTENNYNRFTDSRSLQFTTARARSSTSSLAVTAQRLLTMGAPPSLPPGGHCFTTTPDSD
jgi:hypothetical protein